MQNQPLFLLLMIGVSAYVIQLWWSDWQRDRSARANPKAFPGAASASSRALIIAAAGAAVILAAETGGELRLGLSSQQSNMTALFAIYTLCAAFVEEIVFRGYIVIEHRGAALRWAGVWIASLLFAALHPFLWDWTGKGIQLHSDEKGVFSTAAVFVSSLWFYTVRFANFNPRRSLWPCFCAHLTKNLGVIAIKLIQGHLIGWF